MTVHGNGPAGIALPLELRWDHAAPLPSRWVIPDRRRHRVPPTTPADQPFDFSTAMSLLCTDVAARCETFRHVHMPRVLVTFTPSRNRSRYGLQARVTPLRFRNGSLTRRHGPVEYQVQRFFVNGREMLYLMTFCLPRFLDQTFEEKLLTVFHETLPHWPQFRWRPAPPPWPLCRPYALEGPVRLAHGRAGAAIRRGSSRTRPLRLPESRVSRIVGSPRGNRGRGRSATQAASGRTGHRDRRGAGQPDVGAVSRAAPASRVDGIHRSPRKQNDR